MMGEASPLSYDGGHSLLIKQEQNQMHLCSPFPSWSARNWVRMDCRRVTGLLLYPNLCPHSQAERGHQLRSSHSAMDCVSSALS